MIDSLKHAFKTAILQVTDNYIAKQQENIQIYLVLNKGNKRKNNRILTKFSEINLKKKCTYHEDKIYIYTE